MTDASSLRLSPVAKPKRIRLRSLLPSSVLGHAATILRTASPRSGRAPRGAASRVRLIPARPHAERNISAVVLQECRPSLGWLGISRCSSHPPRHRSLRDIEAKYLELAVNPWRSPRTIFAHRTEDELAQLPVTAISSGTLAMPREPSPVKHEASAMLSNNGFRLNKDQSSPPSRPEAPQYDPEESVGIRKTRLGGDVTREPKPAAAKPGFPGEDDGVTAENGRAE